MGAGQQGPDPLEDTQPCYRAENHQRNRQHDAAMINTIARYDLGEDPHEFTNVAEAYPEGVRRLRRILEDARSSALS